MATEKRDYYEVLDIPRDSTQAEIKKAYYRMAMRYHPDKNPDDEKAEVLFKECAEAYEILSDSTKRERYDRFGHSASGGGMGSEFSSMEDIFQEFADIFGKAGSDTFGGVRSERRKFKGEDLKFTLELTLEEIYEGVEKVVEIKKVMSCNMCKSTGGKNADPKSFRYCKECKGSGTIEKEARTILGNMVTKKVCEKCNGEGKLIEIKCEKCEGEGVAEDKERTTVAVPKGILEKEKIIIKGKGNAGKKGGDYGDLIIIIKQIPHKNFVRRGDNLHYDLRLNLADLYYGIRVKIPMITGAMADIEVPEKTQSGRTFLIEGMGIPNMESTKKGNMVITAYAHTPQDLTSDETIIIDHIQKSKNFKPNK